MSNDLLLLALDAALVTCAVAQAIATLARSRAIEAWVVTALCAAIVAHVILGRQDYGAWVAAPFRIDLGPTASWLDLLRNSAPGLLMILARRAFCEDRRLPGWLLALFVLQLGLEGPLSLAAPGLAVLGTEAVPTLLQALFASLAAWWTVEDWRADLVDARRRARAVMLLILAVSAVASSILLRVVIPWDSYANFQAHVALSGFNLVVLLALLARGPADFGLQRRPAALAPAAARWAADDAALARLEALLTNERIYREPDLTPARLARRVAVPEYRLRRLILERLGFRNFNAFLHAHRIAEVRAALENPDQRQTPILTLALDAGYQSVNTFNRAFREATGATPSVFRQAADLRAASPKAA